ncbi:hypothetical protein [Streptomyces sp. DH12]|uniref:hypothetical protein n=1 Tax=Streptomyces sp. DH12 TaxID=2857010 RepID=UPI001E5A9267|nr:hypothetical protein [Streptomyces sp. DH12]
MRLGPPSSTALTAAALILLAGAAAPASATTATAAPPASTTAAAPASPARAAAPAPAAATHCVPAAPLRLQGSQRPAGPAVGLCVTVTGASMTVSASADCACTTSGTWTARRGDADETSGTLGARAEYAGPGTYAVTATVSIGGAHRGASPATPLTGTVGGTFALASALPAPTHRIEVTPSATLRPGTTTTLTYKVTQLATEGDGSARLGIIGEPGSGVSVTSPDARCVNPLTSGAPATRRSPHAVDCTFTDLAVGRPAAVTVRVTVPSGTCSTVVSKLGYWTPKGQQVSGAMLNGPTVSCR